MCNVETLNKNEINYFGMKFFIDDSFINILFVKFYLCAFFDSRLVLWVTYFYMVILLSSFNVLVSSFQIWSTGLPKRLWVSRTRSIPLNSCVVCYFNTNHSNFACPWTYSNIISALSILSWTTKRSNEFFLNTHLEQNQSEVHEAYLIILFLFFEACAM